MTRRLSRGFNVRLVDFVNTRESLMDPLGLAALGLVDAQCHYRGLDHADMARWMYALGHRLFTAGDVMADGDAVPGLDPAEQWTCRHQRATMPPDRLTLDIEPSRRKTGHRAPIIWGSP